MTGANASDPQASERRPHAGPVRRIARNGAIGLSASLGHTLLTLLALAILARALGREGLGLYFTVFVISVVLQLVLEAGVTTIITMRVSRAPGRWRQTGAEAAGLLAVAVVGSLLAGTAVACGWSSWRGQEAFGLLGIATGVTCAAMQIEQFGFGVFRGFERFEFEGLAKLVQGGSFVLLVWLFVGHAGGRLPAAVSCLAASHTLAALVVLGIVAGKWPIGWPVFHLAVARDWLADALPLGVGIMLRRLTLQLGHILLAMMQPLAALGLYNVAIRPLGPLNLVPQAAASAVFPHLARSAGHDLAGLRKVFAASVRLLLVVSLPVAASVWLLADHVVLLLAGPEFAAAAAPMRVLGGVLVLSYPSAQFRFVLTALGKQALFWRLVAATLAAELVLETTLIPAYGYLGACWGFLLGEVGFLVAGLVLCQRCGLHGLEWRGMAKAVVVAVALAAVCWPAVRLALPWQLLTLLAATSVYLAVCLGIGAVTPGEARRLARLLRRSRQAPPVAGQRSARVS